MKEKGKSKKAKFAISIFALCLSFAVNLSAQNLDILAEQIKNGSTEEKREALFQLRNLETAEASRIAALALQDPTQIVRATAVYSVIYLSSDEAGQVLLPLLQDTSVFVRQETIYALGKTRNSNAVQPLLEILQRAKELEVKTASAVSLGDIGEISAIDSLLKVLQKKPKEEEDFLRRSAARAIGQIAQVQQFKLNYVVTPESILPEKYDTFVNFKYSNLAKNVPSFRQSISVLLAVLQNPKEADDVRREAAFALGTIGDESAVKTLQNNLIEKDYYLAEIAKESLLKISS